MSKATDTAEAFATALSLAGRTLTFNGSSLNCLLSRERGGKEDGDQTPLDNTDLRIRFLKSAVDVLPEVGDVLSDSDGYQYRLTLEASSNPEDLVFRGAVRVQAAFGLLMTSGRALLITDTGAPLKASWA